MLTVACAAGTGTALLAAAGTAGAGTTVQVQAFTVPAAAYALPLASPAMPMALDPSGQGEWFLVSGAAGGTLLDEPAAGGTPSVVSTGLDDNSGKAAYLSLVATGGSLAYAWSVADGYQVLGLTSSGSAIQLSGAVKVLYDSFKPDAKDITADTSGNLFIPDNAGGDITRANFSHLNGSQWQLPSSFTTPKPDAVVFAGGLVWFSTDSGQLGSVSPSSTASDTNGPYSGVTVNGNGHTLAAGPDGNLWAVSGGPSGSGGSAIVKIAPSSGSVLATYTAGLPANPQISAITAGPDGNIWFTESGANEIGQLNIASGAITNFPLPAGYQLLAPGAGVIAPGSSSSGTLFFAAQSGGAPAIGLISLATTAGTTSGTTTTATTTTTTTTTTTPTSTQHATGRVSVASKAAVTGNGVASVKLSCKGGPCTGRLSLLLIRKQKVRVRHKLVTKRQTLTIGSASFKLAASRSETLKIKLTRTGRLATAAASGGGLSVTAKVRPSSGKSRSSSVSLVESHRAR